MTASGICSRLEGVVKTSNGFAARCPAHEDKNPSLTISTGADGCILVYCQAGCSIDSICAALHITKADLFAKRNGNHGIGRPVAEYDYRDEAGKLLYQVVRSEPKAFRQRQPDPTQKNGWRWNMDGARRVLYRLPEVLKAIGSGFDPIVVVEGEKDVAALVSLEFNATCNVGGAASRPGDKKWLASYTETLRDADVVVIPDNDDGEKGYPGQRHAETVADALSGKAKRVRVVTLPDVPNGMGLRVKDCHDFFALGGTAKELIALIDAAPEWKPGTKIAPVTGEAKTELPWLDLLQDGALIIQEELPPIVQLVDGLITECSKVAIASGAKSNKTWITIDGSLSISHGVQFLGRSTLQRTVLYCNLELRDQTFKRRVQTVAKAKGITVNPGAFIHLPLRGKLSGLTVLEIISRIISVAIHVKAGVVVIDPVYKINVEGDENSSRDQTVLYNQIDRVTTEAGCTVILNDHFSKGNQSEKDPLDAIRGSSAKGGDVDAAIILRRHDVNDCFRVDVIHRELPPVDPFCIGWNFPLMELRADLDPENMKKAKGGKAKSHDPRQLLAVISDRAIDNPISISKWADAAEVERSTLYGYLDSMRIKGWIMTVGEGNGARQYITQKGIKVAGELAQGYA